MRFRSPPSFGQVLGTWTGRLRGLALAVALLALCALALSAWATAAAQTPTDTTLVSTLGQTTSTTSYLVGTPASNRYILAQKLSTGRQSADSYTLSKAVIDIHSVTGSPTVQVSIYSEVSGNPGSSLYVMTNPASISVGPKHLYGSQQCNPEWRDGLFPPS